jgi:hypothetical protein
MYVNIKKSVAFYKYRTLYEPKRMINKYIPNKTNINEYNGMKEKLVWFSSDKCNVF